MRHQVLIKNFKPLDVYISLLISKGGVCTKFAHFRQGTLTGREIGMNRIHQYEILLFIHIFTKKYLFPLLVIPMTTKAKGRLNGVGVAMFTVGEDHYSSVHGK